MATVTAASACANCGTLVDQHFCPHCGQGSGDHSRSVIEMIREVIEHHFFIDGRTIRSVYALCFQPGTLTRAYIEGRRVRFLSPIRLYLFASIAFLLTLWAGDVAVIQFSTDPSVAPGSDVLPSVVLLEPAGKGFQPPDSWRTKLHADPGFATRLTDGVFYQMAHPRALNEVLDDWLPRLTVALLPISAMGLALVNWRRRLFFVDHLTFALHGQAFAFLLVSVALALRLAWPGLPHLAAGLSLIVLVYTYLAFRHVYGGRWFAIAFKIAFVGSAYLVLLASGLVGVLIYGFATLNPS
jgi:hypothetical protein